MKMACIWMICVFLGIRIGGAERAGVPSPLAEHPGNVFLAGENVVVHVPAALGRLTLLDYDGKELASFPEDQKTLALGKLPIGFYRLQSERTNHWVSLAVLERLRAPTPLSSPIGVDVAMAWFYDKGRMDAVANLCTLAGINWVRDRLTLGEMEPARGEFSGPNKYDASAAAQSGAGLRVLQVIHLSPSWANPNAKRFPLDLRDAYHFYEAMARRWAEEVQAFEPWNEADIPMFGGHIGAEMAALQKAAYLGLKAGNPEMIACLNVFALHNTNQLADVNENQAWPYFDTYNLHHYEPFENYPKLYADHRAVSAGRPLWVSECAVPVKWAGDEQLKEPSDSDQRLQAERVVKTFACSLHEGTAATFYFLFPHYVEGQTQFGIVRPDLTPRPAYVSLAAVGRLLADAKPLGRWQSTNSAVQAYLFRARPGGKEREVLVAWSSQEPVNLEALGSAQEIFDHIGRPLPTTRLTLTRTPLFALFTPGTAEHLPLSMPPSPAPRAMGKPSTVVLQAVWPADQLDLKHSALRLPATNTVTIPVFVYNFGAQRAKGKLGVQASSDLRVTFPQELQIGPGERIETTLQLEGADPLPAGTVRISGDFGAAGESVLSLRVRPAPRP